MKMLKDFNFLERRQKRQNKVNNTRPKMGLESPFSNLREGAGHQRPNPANRLTISQRRIRISMGQRILNPAEGRRNAHL